MTLDELIDGLIALKEGTVDGVKTGGNCPVVLEYGKIHSLPCVKISATDSGIVVLHGTP